jgi:excisionase family DNA binding protein
MVMTVERPPKLVTLSGAAAYLGVGRDVVRAAVNTGQIPTVVVGQRRWISTLALDRLLSGSAEAGVE